MTTEVTTPTVPPETKTKTNHNNSTTTLTYHAGFGNHIESSSHSHPYALPIGRNNPRIVPCGLYTEQLSGTAFTAPRGENRRTWLYRKVPSVVGSSCDFVACGGDDLAASSLSLPKTFGKADWSKDLKLDPNPMRWGATPLVLSPTAQSPCSSQEEEEELLKKKKKKESNTNINFLQGIHTMMGSGDPTCKSGIGIYVYACNSNMMMMSSTSSGGEAKGTADDYCDGDDGDDMHCYNSDGDFLIVPQQLTLWIQTEMGRMTVSPGEICVIPRGVVFTVNIHDDDNNKQQDGKTGDQKQDEKDNSNKTTLFARGYILEIFRGHFQLPELGPIGSNGLANARDFLHPTAHYESNPDIANKACTIVNKFGQELFARTSPHSPYNVVAWHGNYLPFKYDLKRFCAVNSVTYDHLDPSIYTVLTAKGGDEDGTALADFVIFPPRVMATDENTFRPPWFHRNVMTEFMGLIYGEYDAKKKKSGSSSAGGFVPGGASLHSIMTPHGPDSDSYYANVQKPCDEPAQFDGGLAFMFETSAMCKVSRYALECEQRERDYACCWDGLVDTFSKSHV